MSNFETARDAIEKMSHSMGDADKEMDVITHSLSYKINNLKETFTGIWQNLIDRGELGAVVDAFSGIVGVIDTITGKLGGFKTLALGAGIFEFVKHFGDIQRVLGNAGNAFMTVIQQTQSFSAATSSAFSAGIQSVSAFTQALGIAAIAVGAIAIAYKVFDHYNESWDEAKEKAEDSRSAYEDTKSEIEKVNGEYETMQSRIKELEARNGSLKPMEQAELDRLKSASDELLRQKGLLEDLAGQQGLKAATDSAHFLEKDGLVFDTYKKEMRYDSFGGEMGEFMTTQTGTIIDRYTTAKNAIQDLEKEQKEVQERLRNYSDEDKAPSLFGGLFGKTDYEKDKAQLDDIEERLSSARQQVIDDGKLINENYQALFDEDGNIYSGYEGLVDNIRTTLYSTAEEIAEQTQKTFDEIINKTSDYKTQFNKLVSQAKENGGISADDITEEYQDLVNALAESDFSIDDLVLQVNAEAEIKNADELKGQLEDILNEDIDGFKVKPDIEIDESALEEKKSEIQKAFSELNSEEQSTFLKNIQDVDWSSWDLGDIPDKVKELANATEDLSGKTEELTGTFSDMDTLFGDDAEFGGKVDNFVKQLDTLKQALDQFNKGELTESDMFDLQKQFASLLGDADFENFGKALSDAISAILDGTGDAAEGLKEFGDAVEGAGSETEEATNLVDLFDQAIQRVGKNSQMGQWLEEYKQHFKEFYTEVKTAKETLDEFNGYQSTYHGIKSSNTNVTGLSLDEIKDIEKVYKDLDIKFNREDLFVGTATGIRLNTQALKELNEQVENTTLSNLESELDSLRQRQADGETGLEDDIADAEYLIAQYEGMTSAYNNWVKAKSGSDNRDPMFSVQSGMENVDKLIEGGWFGDEEVTTMIDLLLSADQKTGDVEKDWEKVTSVIKGANGELEKYGFKWSDLFTKDDKGNETTTGLFKFLDVLEQAHGEIISTNEDGTKSIKMTGEQLDQLATQFGTSADWLTIILSALADIDPNLHFTVDADTSEAEEDIDTVRRDAEGNPITLDVVAKPVSSPTEAAENAGHNARNAFTFGFGDTGGGNGGGGGSSDTSSGGEEHSVETQEVTVEVKQEPDPLVLNVSVPGADGEGESLLYKLQVEADYGEGGDGLTLKINPPTGDGVTEDGVYTLQTAIAGVANDEGAFTLSVPSPEGAEGDTYTLSVAAGGIADSSGAISLTVNPEGANEDGSFEITVQAANDGKVLVSAVGPDGSDTISAVVEPNLTALGTAISAFQEELNNNPLKVAVEQSTTHQTSSGQTAGGGGRSFGTSEEPSETAPTEIPGKLVIEEVEYNIEEDPEVDGILNVNEVEENIEEQPEIEGSVKATELDVSGVETPTIDADININGGATLTVDSTAVDQAVTDATQTVQGFNGQTGTAILDGDNSSLASSVSESETLVDGLNSKTATPAFSADTSQLDSSVSESEAKVDALDAKTAEPTATLNDQASGVISNISKALTDLDGRTAHTTVVTTHVTQGGTDAGGGGGKFATGTLTTAHASGTAYNVFNYRPAYSNGKVALSKDEIALVNELGKTLPKCTVMYIMYHGKSVKSQKWSRPRLNRVVTTRATSIAI